MRSIGLLVVLAAGLAGCIGGGGDGARAVGGAPEHCNTQVEVAFDPALSDDDLRAAAERLIREPGADAKVSIRDPITSYYAKFTENVVCIEFDKSIGAKATNDAYVMLSKADPNVIAVRHR